MIQLTLVIFKLFKEDLADQRLQDIKRWARGVQVFPDGHDKGTVPFKEFIEREGYVLTSRTQSPVPSRSVLSEDRV